MPNRLGAIALAAGVAGAAALAWLGADRTAAPAHDPRAAGAGEPTAASEEEEGSGVLPPGHPPLDGLGPQSEGAGRSQAAGLPPGHPPLGAAAQNVIQGSAGDESPAVGWTVPRGWQIVPNPNAMRIATYRVPGPATAESAEMSVARAGGTTEANIQRWLGEFDDAGQDHRTEKNVRGLAVTIVEVTGTFLGGGMGPGSAPTPHPRWSLLAAIVETRGSPYFFKLVGPAATVRAAHAAFDALVASITPS
jgi:hypothetical protein